jgi:hypothetical protein
MVGQVHHLWHWLFGIHTIDVVFSRRRDFNVEEWNFVSSLRCIAVGASIYEIGGQNESRITR